MELRHLPQEISDGSLSSIPVEESLLPPNNRQEAAATPANTLDIANTVDMQVTSTESATLTTLLQQEARYRRRETCLTLVWAGAYGSIIPWILNFQTTRSFEKFLLFYCILMSLLAVGVLLPVCYRIRHRKRTFTEALSCTSGRQQLGPLIQTLKVQDTPVRNLVKQSLIKLLPTLQASDASQISEADRKILLRQLAISPTDSGYRDLRELFSKAATRREMDLRLVILKALEQVGGEQELATVEGLAHGRHLGTYKVPQEIQKAARACLPYLQMRVGVQRASTQLLRASSIHATSSDTLLRPASSQLEILPEQLLRASDPHS